MNTDWIRIRSWHAIRNWTRVPDRAVTLCGRTADGTVAADLPMGEKSCETCLRLSVHREEAAPT